MQHGDQINAQANYPADAYARPGELWWEIEKNPLTGRRLGQTARIAAWLWFNKSVGDTFTMNELRAALGPEIVGQSEHLNRRLRELRKAEWQIPSGKDSGAGIAANSYRVDKKGARYWLDVERRSVAKFAPSAKTRRLVFERDGSRCAVCGVAAGERYPEDPTRVARLTIGHRVPQERLRQYRERDNLDNWRTECAQCNETVRDLVRDPHRYEEVAVQVRALSGPDKSSMREWLERGERTRSKLDRVYDLARTLSASDRDRILRDLEGF